MIRDTPYFSHLRSNQLFRCYICYDRLLNEVEQTGSGVINERTKLDCPGCAPEFFLRLHKKAEVVEHKIQARILETGLLGG